MFIGQTGNIPEKEFVYIDETGMDRFIYRERACAPKGEAVTGRVNGRKYRRVGIVSGLEAGKPISPLVYDGTMDSLPFETWFGKCLLPSLSGSEAIVMDNAAFHRKKRLLAMAEECGHRLIFRPPYSPELNPIEKFWSWLKRKLRKILPSHSSLGNAICEAFKVIDYNSGAHMPGNFPSAAHSCP